MILTFPPTLLRSAWAKRRQRRASALAAGLLLASLFAADATAGETRTTDFVLTAGRSPTTEARVLRVRKDDIVRIRVESEAAGEVHLHAYRLVARAGPGVPAELRFNAHATGRFRIEWHPAAASPKKDGHHGPPLAVLEVRPR